MDNWDIQLIEHASTIWRPEWKVANQRAGELNKKGKGTFRKTWHKRWFVLKNEFLFYFKKKTDAEPSGILFLDSTSTIEYYQSTSFLQDSYCLKLFVANSCSLENKKCFTSREYIFSAQCQSEAQDWKAGLEKAIQTPALKNSETILAKGDSPKRIAEFSKMVISQPVLISKKTFAISKNTSYSHRRNSVSDDLNANKTEPFNIPNSYHPRSSTEFLSTSNNSISTSSHNNERSYNHERSLSSNTHDRSYSSTTHERSFSSRYRSSMSGMLHNSQDGKYSLNILICKSIADSIRSFLGILNKIEHEIEKANSNSNFSSFLDFLSCEQTLEYFTLMFNNCEQILEELHDIETEIITVGSFQNLENSTNDLVSSVNVFILSMKNSCNAETQNKDCFIKFHLEIDNLNDFCRQILTSISEIVKHQASYISSNPSSLSQSHQSIDTIPETPISNNEEDERRTVQDIIDKEIYDSENASGIVFKESEDIASNLIVRGGTLEKLVERLTFHCKPDARFMYIFLLTYRSFTNARELLLLLIDRYNSTSPLDLSSKQKEIYKTKKLIPIRLSWIKSNFEDFQRDPELLDILKNFLPKMRMDFKKGTDDFEMLLEKLKNNESPIAHTACKLPKAPASLLPKKMESFSFIDLDPLEIARQMTLIEWKLYSSIKPSECLEQAWNNKELQYRSPNILSLIKHLNFVAYWIGTEITGHSNVKNRAASLKQFISIAEKCKSLNNFNALMAILAGINTTAISRLKKTWELLPTKIKSSFDSLNELMSESKSFKNYRQELAIAEPPCIPFLGVYLTNLVFIETGNKDCLPEYPNYINFDKRHKIAKVIEELSSFQRTQYNLNEISAIRDFILNQNIKKEQEIYELSILLEPKEILK